MNFLLSINAAPDSPFSESALIFARTLLQKNQNIHGLFFFGDGVRILDEGCERSQGWLDFLTQHKHTALCCSAASSMHLSKESLSSLHLRVAGLGELIELCETADRVVCFGSRPN